MTTESSVIRAMNWTARTSHTSEADQSAGAGAEPNMAAVSPQVASVPTARSTATNAELTAALTTTNALRETGFVSTRIAVPLRHSAETIPP